jgi:RNA polymerase sigma-70 factor (ECF subfamily)
MTPPPAQKDRFLQHFTGSEHALRGFISSVVFAPSDREDILQEVALRLWQLYHRYDDTRPFTAWALGVASLRMKEECRKATRRPVLLDEAQLESMTAAFTDPAGDETADPEAALAACLEALPAEAARLIRERYYGEKSINALSQSSGQSIASIYQTLCRLRRRLAKCINSRLQHEPSSTPSNSHVS